MISRCYDVLSGHRTTGCTVVLHCDLHFYITLQNGKLNPFEKRHLLLHYHFNTCLKATSNCTHTVHVMRSITDCFLNNIYYLFSRVRSKQDINYSVILYCSEHDMQLRLAKLHKRFFCVKVNRRYEIHNICIKDKLHNLEKNVMFY